MNTPAWISNRCFISRKRISPIWKSSYNRYSPNSISSSPTFQAAGETRLTLPYLSLWFEQAYLRLFGRSPLFPEVVLCKVSDFRQVGTLLFSVRNLYVDNTQQWPYYFIQIIVCYHTYICMVWYKLVHVEYGSNSRNCRTVEPPLKA